MADNVSSLDTPTFIPGQVRVVNLTPSEMDVILRGGTSFHLLPFSRDWEAHVSPPFFKKLLTDALRGMQGRGLIEIREVTR
jgi:hypothetical protein